MALHGTLRKRRVRKTRVRRLARKIVSSQASAGRIGSSPGSFGKAVRRTRRQLTKGTFNPRSVRRRRK